MYDKIVVDRWLVCLPMFLLVGWSLIAGLENLLVKDNWGMFFLDFVGVVLWTLVGIRFLNQPKMKSAEDDEVS